MAGFKEKLLKLARKKAKEENYSSKDYRAMLKMTKIMDLYEEIEKLGFSPICMFTGNDNYIDARFSANQFLNSLIDNLTKEGTAIENK